MANVTDTQAADDVEYGSDDSDVIDLYELQLECGAEFAATADMKVAMVKHYASGVEAEYHQAKHAAALFDNWGQMLCRIAGKGATSALDKIMANKVSAMKIGSCAANLMLNNNGGVLDKFLIYYMDKDDYLLLGSDLTDFEAKKHLQSLLPVTAKFADFSEDLAKFDLVGPKSAEVLQQLGVAAKELPELNRWNLIEIDDVRFVIARLNVGGQLAYKLFFDRVFDGDFFAMLLDEEIVTPAGFNVWRLLELEQGNTQKNCELRNEWSGAESGVINLSALEKDTRAFIGRRNLGGATHQIVGLTASAEQNFELSPGRKLYTAAGELCGEITSSGYSYDLKRVIALARVEKSSAAAGNKLKINFSEDDIELTVTELPFISADSVNKK